MSLIITYSLVPMLACSNKKVRRKRAFLLGGTGLEPVARPGGPDLAGHRGTAYAPNGTAHLGTPNSLWPHLPSTSLRLVRVTPKTWKNPFSRPLEGSSPRADEPIKRKTMATI